MVLTKPRSIMRRMTQRLSFKIFVVFWTAMTFAGVVLLALETARAQRLNARWRGVTGDAFAVYAATVASDLEDPDKLSAQKFLTDLEKRTGIQAWFYNAKGRELTGFAPEQRRVLASYHAQRIQSLLTRASGSGRIEFDTTAVPTLAAHAGEGPSGRRFVLLGVLPTTRYGPWQAAPDVQALRLLAVLVAAGSVSWVLARHLTTPVEKLRAATQRLAEGDFSARANFHGMRRHDELVALALDFDAMAERMQTLLRDQERLVVAQRRLLGDVAHELRSPLARLNVALELARDHLSQIEVTAANSAGSRQLPASLDRIEQEVSRLKELIDRLLVLSRLESGVQKPGDTPVDLGALVTAVIADANYEAQPEKHVQGSSECETCVVRGSPELIHSAIENVVRNAVRYTAPGSSVEVILEQEDPSSPATARWNNPGLKNNCYVSTPQETSVSSATAAPSQIPLPTGWAIIRVTDQGPGVPQADLGNMFLPFYRAGSGRASREGGVGLGLAITMRAVELHGGQIRACNMVDGGLAVELRLPLHASSPSALKLQP